MRTKLLNPVCFLGHRSRAFAVGLGLAASGCDLGSDGEPDYLEGFGQVLVYSTHNEGVASAYYRPLEGPACPSAVSVSDSCGYRACRFSPSALPPPRSAGAVGISGLKEDFLLAPLDTAVEGSLYPTERREQPLFTGGEVVRFEIAGAGDIPAASGELIAPEFLSLTSPVLPEPEEDASDEEDEEGEENAAPPRLRILRGDDLKIAWEPRPAGELPVDVNLTVRKQDGSEVLDYAYTCQFAAELGEGQLSRDILKYLPVSDETVSASLYVGRDAIGTVTGKWEHLYAVSALDIFPVTLE